VLPIIGLVVVIASVIVGYTSHNGRLEILWQPTEFLIIGGAGLGSYLIANPPSVLKGTLNGLLGLLKPNPFSKKAFGELLQVMFELFQTARREGLVALESHVEEPDKSTIFRKYPQFNHHGNARAFLCDTLKVLMTGAVEDHLLSDILDVDLERRHEEEHAVTNALTKVSDAMPGFGIVAAVLGVVVTMGSIGGAASEIGEKVAAALVGTFLGVLMAYGFLGPLASALEARARGEAAYLQCIRTGLLSFARGDSPMTCVEFARRNIEPVDRPSFSELEKLTRRKAA
jgi:chemotaxis protein MotA